MPEVPGWLFAQCDQTRCRQIQEMPEGIRSIVRCPYQCYNCLERIGQSTSAMRCEVAYVLVAGIFARIEDAQLAIVCLHEVRTVTVRYKMTGNGHSQSSSHSTCTGLSHRKGKGRSVRLLRCDWLDRVATSKLQHH